MNDTIECPQSGDEMYFDIIDENGAHYNCPNCEYERSNTSTRTKKKIMTGRKLELK